MLASTPSPSYLPQFSRDSPSYRSPFGTPPRFKSDSISPFNSPIITPSPLRARNTIDPDDVFFHSPSTSRLAARRSHPISTPPPFVPPTTSLPLRTPVKDSHHKIFPSVPDGVDSPVGLGAKRKPAPLTISTTTPLRKRTTTSLNTAPNAQISCRPSTESFAFERLAPLTAPRFPTQTPQTKAETEIALKRQAETMKKLKIGDLDLSEDESDVGAVDDPRLFLSRGEEVPTTISPGGHVTKRRVRSRPVSRELLEDAAGSPFLVKPVVPARPTNRSPFAPITFPTLTSLRPRRGSNSSSGSDCPSPVPLRRVQVGAGPRSRTTAQSAARLPFNRHTSNSSATLFFGPSIPDLIDRAADTASLRPNVDACRTRSKVANRHSHSGFDTKSSWDMTPSRSPYCVEDMEGDDFFSPSDSSFAITVTQGTPSPRSRTNTGQMLPKKYKPRDSGVLFEDDDDKIPVMPTASTSVSTIYSGDEDLVTPIYSPGTASGWPVADDVIVVNSEEDGFMQVSASSSGMSLNPGADADGFIMRLLVDGGQLFKDRASKKMPETPVKRMKTTHFAVNRPWQSAFTTKVGSEEFNYLAPLPGKAGKGKNPRKSLPAAFPMLMGGGDGDSPTDRKETKYAGLGLGRPRDISTGVKGVAGRAHWLMRRSSSGAFSSGSETSGSFPILGTPTRLKGKDFKLPPPRIPVQFSPLKDLRLSSDQRSISSSSTSHTSTTNSPTSPHIYRPGGTKRTPGHHRTSPLKPRHSNIAASSEERPGKFERDFIVIDDDIGSGEFGRVLKVRRIVGDDEEFISLTSKDENVFAVKKSKPLEGVKHRLRLREEVDVLRQLTHAAAADVGAQTSGRPGHPNVLGYVDSWEQDGVLYIQTELCEFGSFGRFLWEYGRAFPRLDEVRVWKILADLSNGMLFIHDNGIIHLDLKPANVFINGDGRFKIGDFGMASVWPRLTGGGFEREGDKQYMAAEVLQGRYGKAADIFGLGMMMLEAATNIIVPGQGDAWHRLRQENFEQVDMEDSPELFELIKSMMRTNAALRVDIRGIWSHRVVSRTRAAMERVVTMTGNAFAGSPLASVPGTFLREILERLSEDDAMDLGP